MLLLFLKLCLGFNSNWFDYSHSFKICAARAARVSIPTGSITVFRLNGNGRVLARFNSNWFDYSVGQVGLAFPRQLFQFQLVRLQYIEKIKLHPQLVVSIPTGSITVVTATARARRAGGFNSNWFDYSLPRSLRTRV